MWLAENACFGSARKWHFHLQDFDKVNGCIRTHFPGPVFFVFFLEIISCSVCAHVCMCMFVRVGARELCWVSSSITLYLVFIWGGAGTLTELGALGQ